MHTPVNCSKNLTQSIGGMKYTVAKDSQESGKREDKEKVTMKFEVYSLMCDLLLFVAHDE